MSNELPIYQCNMLPEDSDVLFRDLQHLAGLVQLLLALSTVFAVVPGRHAEQEDVTTRPTSGPGQPQNGRPEKHRFVVRMGSYLE